MNLPDEIQHGDGDERRLGLRERKRQQTRKRLKDVAIRLFLERGFDETTLDDIVAAADISRRTFFHYFASKEDLVFGWQDDIGEAVAAEIARRPRDEPPLLAASQALINVASGFEREYALTLGRLIKDTPALRARDQVKYEGLERILTPILSQRIGEPPEGLRSRLIAMVVVGALRIGTETWLVEGGREPPVQHARRAFDILCADLTASHAARQDDIGSTHD